MICGEVRWSCMHIILCLGWFASEYSLFGCMERAEDREVQLLIEGFDIQWCASYSRGSKPLWYHS